MAEPQVAVARTPRAILSHFTVHEATAPERAMGFNPTQPSETELFEQLRSDGVIRRASPGLFWVDETRLAERQAAAMARVAVVGTVAGLVVAGIAGLRARRRRKAALRRA
jgi:hypothetical protein